MIRLRQAQKDDFDFLFDLRKITMKQYFDQLYQWDETYQRENFFKKMPLKKIRIIVQNEKEIGFILYSEVKRYFFFEYIIIHPSHQHKGIGTYIVSWILARANKGNKHVIGQLLKINVQSLKFWLKLGFEVIKESDLCLFIIKKRK